MKPDRRLEALAAVVAAVALIGGDAQAQARSVAVEDAPSPSVAPVYPAEFRTDEIELSLSEGGDREGAEVEYLVKTKPGRTVVYSWSVTGLDSPDEFYSQFHGHRRSGPEPRVMNYVDGVGAEGHGALVAPFEGTHGWLFQNQSLKPVTVRLKLAGFYELLSIREAMLLDETTESLPFGPEERTRPATAP